MFHAVSRLERCGTLIDDGTRRDRECQFGNAAGFLSTVKASAPARLAVCYPSLSGSQGWGVYTRQGGSKDDMEARGVNPSRYGLEQHGLQNLGQVYWNLGTAALVENAIRRQEGLLAAGGAFVVRTGQYTGRSPNDKFVVREPSSQDRVWWGPVNRPFEPARFDALYGRLLAYLQGADLYVQDCFVGADPAHRIPIRVVTEYAWHNLFARQLFVRPDWTRTAEHVPRVTIIDVPKFHAYPDLDGTRSEAFVVVHFAKGVVIIGGTSYAGEMKKSAFTLLNFLLPLQRVLSMHCSANLGPRSDVALFFGLSGTGKTTLSADPGRRLIGDDEHGWSDRGIFNFEGGCYAKCINLSRQEEPQVWDAIRFGAVLENVRINPETRLLDFSDRSLTELPLSTIAQVFASEAMVKAAKDSAEIFGAMGVMRDMPLQKYIHDARVCQHSGNGNSEAKLRLAELISGYRRSDMPAIAAE